MLYKCLVVLLIASASAQSKCGQRKAGTANRIINGVKSESGEWPWLACLISIPDQKFFCGATIVSEKALITAAHCLQPKNEPIAKNHTQIVAFLGKHNLTVQYEKGVEAFYPNNVLLHPEWNILSDKYDADLAILRSDYPIRFSATISPACFWNGNINEIENVEGVVVGWGSSKTSKLEPVPLYLEVKQVPDLNCFLDNDQLTKISTKRTFCGDGGTDSSPCTGDSGGGFFVFRNNVYHIYGVVSVSLKDSSLGCDVTKNTVFTKLSEFTDWIRSEILTEEAEVEVAPSCHTNDEKRKTSKEVCTFVGMVSMEEFGDTF